MYAGIVLRNVKNPISSVKYEAVFDALLSGGVFLDEVTFLPYDAPSELTEACRRLSLTCDGIFLVCDGIIVPFVRNVLANAAGKAFEEEYTLETETCLYAVLPSGERGAEIVRTETVPRVDRRRRNSYARIVVRAVAAPSELVNDAIKRAGDIAGNTMFFHVSEKYGCLRLEAVYDAETPKMIADEVSRILVGELSDYIYAIEDVSIAERLCDLLKLHRMKISTAESFTGGGVGREIVRVPGASAVFYEGINAYDSDAKRDRLGVKEFTLKQNGAVSDETAYEMAAGLIACGHCDLAIATTGIAGPSSDRSNLPPGLCFIAIGTKTRVRVFRFQLSGDRETVTETAINLALFHAFSEINNGEL